MFYNTQNQIPIMLFGSNASGSHSLFYVCLLYTSDAADE